ncbi:MAG: 2,3-bisphosphoglycerate-independent phosphoglycerate mutase, partial [Pseudomonadota bacterium]
MKQKPKPAILCILDGWGQRSNAQNNAIALAKTPNYDRFLSQYAHADIGTDGPHVGLPEGQMGNSEVGHMNIGAGRVALPEFGRIDAMLGDGTMSDNRVLTKFMADVKAMNGACHLMGLLSPGGVHAHQDQLLGFAHLLAEQNIKVYIHAFADGRDMPPKSAMECFDAFVKEIKYDSIQLATISGRFYAMDRDNRWERVQLAYDTIVSAKGERFRDYKSLIEQSYAQEVTDEFIVPAVIGDYKGMEDGDGIFMANFRADRAREILQALTENHFTGFQRDKTVMLSAATGAVKYSSELEENVSVLVRPLPYPDGLGETLSKRGLKQLRIAETEKYAHVTFFFNGGVEDIFEGEDRILVP